MKLLILVALAACGGPSTPAKPIANTSEPVPAAHTRPSCDQLEQAACAIKVIDYFMRDMCNCRDRACADKVNSEFTAWSAEMAKQAKPDEAEHVSEDATRQVTELATKYSECFEKLAQEPAP